MKQFAVIQIVIDGDIYGDLSRIETINLANSLEEGKEKANEMFEEFVKEGFGYVYDEVELKDEIEFYKSDECQYEEVEEEDYYMFSFVDENRNNANLRKYIVRAIDE